MPEGKKRREIKRITRYQIIENIILAAIFLVTAYLLYDYIFTTSIIISILKGVALLSVLAVAESMARARCTSRYEVKTANATSSLRRSKASPYSSTSFSARAVP